MLYLRRILAIFTSNTMQNLSYEDIFCIWKKASYLISWVVVFLFKESLFNFYYITNSPGIVIINQEIRIHSMKFLTLTTKFMQLVMFACINFL